MWRDLLGSKRSTINMAAVTSSTIAPDRRSAVRFQLDAPVTFVVEDQKHVGQCIDVSASGLLARFDKPPELWTDGRLDLQAGEHFLDLNARVARRQENQVGFSFSLQTENDRAALGILLGSVSASPVIEPIALEAS